jgi:prophage regulatory protein
MYTEPDRILRLDSTLSMTGESRSAWLAKVAAGNAPAPIRLGPRSIGWRLSEIQSYIAALPRVERYAERVPEAA